MNNCLKWRELLVGTPGDHPPEALITFEATLLRKFTKGRVVENGGLRATRFVMAAALADRFETMKQSLGTLVVPNLNALRQALEETGFVLWNPHSDRPLKF